MISFTLPKRNGHHRDYLEFLVGEWDLANYNVLTCFKDKCKAYRQGNEIILLDIDKSDMFFAVWTFLCRKHWKTSGSKLYGISVRATEFLQERRTLYDLLTKRGRLFYLKRIIKGCLFRELTRHNHVKIYGIFSDFQEKNKLTEYCTAQIHDFQYYDLAILNRGLIRPRELEGISISDALVVFMGSNQERRNIWELKRLLSAKKSAGLKVLLVGQMDLSEEGCVAELIYIKRRLSDGELLWCIKNGGCIYCYYSNNAPSGFYGRSAQFGTPVLVKRDGYLDRSFYTNKISVRDLLDFDPEILRKPKVVKPSTGNTFVRLPRPDHV